RALGDAVPYRISGVLLGDVVHQFHDHNRLAYARATEESDLAAFQERLDQIDNFDSRFEHLLAGRLLFKARRRTMDRPLLGGAKGPKLVYRLADYVDDPANSRLSYMYRNGTSKIDC